MSLIDVATDEIIKDDQAIRSEGRRMTVEDKGIKIVCYVHNDSIYLDDAESILQDQPQ